MDAAGGVTKDALDAVKGDYPGQIALLEPNVNALEFHLVSRLAFAYLQVGRNEDALTTLANGLTRAEGDDLQTAYLLDTRSLILMQLGERDAAIAASDEAVALLPDSPIIAYGRMNIDVNFRTPTAAGEAAARRALDLEPSSPRVLRGAMRFALMTRRRSTAIDLAYRLLKVQPGDAYAYAGLSSVFAVRLQLLKATRYAMRAVRATPDSRFAREALGVTLMFWGIAGQGIVLLPAPAGLFVNSGRPWFIDVLTYVAVLYTTCFITATAPLHRPPLRQPTIWVLRQHWMRPARVMFWRSCAVLTLVVAALAVGFPGGQVLDGIAVAAALATDAWRLIRNPKAYIRGARQSGRWAFDAD